MTDLQLLSEVDTYVFWAANEGAGWMHVLPSCSRLNVLCVDAAGAVAWALAREAAQVTVIHSGSAWAAPTLPTPPLTTPMRHVELDALLGMPAGEPPFDALVIHDPLGERLNLQTLGLLQRLLAQADRLMRPDGWIYLGVSNPHSLQRWRARLRGTPAAGVALPAVSRIVQMLKAWGAADVRRHPYLMTNGRVTEVVGPRGYRATKNREARAERVKEWLFGRRGARHLAPAVGLLALRDVAAPSMLQRLAERTGALRLPAGERAEVVIKQHLVFSGHKAIVTLGPRGRDDRDVVAVLTADAISTRGRATEAPHLAALAHIPSLSAQVPRQLAHLRLGAAECTVLERINGLTLDQDLPPLEPVTDAALRFLIRMHEATAVDTLLDDSGFERLVIPLLRAAADRNPDFAADVAACEAPLRARLQGLTLPAVMQHGDFKVENVIYQTGTASLLAVIDWEHARRPGLPLLDLMYLLAYNRIIRGADWTDAVAAAVVRGEWSPHERARLAFYLAATGLPASLLEPMRVLFLLHHVGCRLHLPPDRELRARVAAMIRSVREICVPEIPSVTSL